MKNPLPVQDLRNFLEGSGFLRLCEQDGFLYVSDAPRRISADTLIRVRWSLRDHGWITEVDSSRLLRIDLQPERWEALLGAFYGTAAVPFPRNEHLLGVYALARLLERHPADFALQPMDMIRSVFKQYGRRDGLPALAPQLLERCAQRLRRGEALPFALPGVLYAWLNEQLNMDASPERGVPA